MTETPEKIPTVIFIPTKSQVCKIKMQEQNFLGRLSHTGASSGQGVSVISLSTVGFTSHSYRSKLWFMRLTHISLNQIVLVQSYKATLYSKVYTLFDHFLIKLPWYIFQFDVVRPNQGCSVLEFTEFECKRRPQKWKRSSWNESVRLIYS